MNKLARWFGNHSGPGGSILVGLGALVVLLAYAPLFHVDTLNVAMMNDQVGYITSARWWADTGELRGHTILPAFVRSPDWRLYMPGHYASLALSYLVLGDSPFAWKLPNLIAFLVTVVLTYDVGRRLFGVRAGVIAAFLVVALPMNVGLALTAMSGPTFSAACLLAFWAFLCLPSRFRWLGIPFLLALPFLFREQGALLVVPMLAVCSLPLTKGAAPRALFAGIGSVGVLSGLYLWQMSAGKSAPPLRWIVEGLHFGDATLVAEDPSSGEWSAALATNVARNARRLADQAGYFMQDWATTTVAILLVFMATSAAIGVTRWKRFGAYPFAAALMAVLALLVVMAFHTVIPSVAPKHLLFVFPFTAIATAPFVGSVIDWGDRRMGRFPSSLVLLGLILPIAFWHVQQTRWLAGDVYRADTPPETSYIESLQHDDTTLLVSPPFGLDYVLKHYPVRWSFVPENDETLALLGQRYVIGTLIVREEHAREAFLPTTLEQLGLHDVRRLKTNAYGEVSRFVVYQRRR